MRKPRLTFDTNALVCSEQGVSGRVRRLLRRCSKGELTGALPRTVWQELTHRLMLAAAAMKHGSSRGNRATCLAGKPEIIRGPSWYRSKVRNLLGLGLRFEICTKDDLLQSAFALQKRYGFPTNAPVVLAVAAIPKTLPGGGAELRC